MSEEWRDIPADAVDWEANPISKRAGGYVRMMCEKMYYREGQSKWSCGEWHRLTLGQIADLGVRHWSRCTNIGPLGIDVIKWVLDEAASGRCPFLAVDGRAAVDAYVPTVRTKEAGE